MDDSAGLLKPPICPLLDAQPGRHPLQHMGVHADEGPGLQKAAQHEGREPAEMFVRPLSTFERRDGANKTYQVLPAASLSPKALKEPLAL